MKPGANCELLTERLGSKTTEVSKVFPNMELSRQKSQTLSSCMKLFLNRVTCYCGSSKFTPSSLSLQKCNVRLLIHSLLVYCMNPNGRNVPHNSSLLPTRLLRSAKRSCGIVEDECHYLELRDV